MKQRVWNILIAGGIGGTAGIVAACTPTISTAFASSKGSNIREGSKIRTFRTAADEYYQQKGKLPLPKCMHSSLPVQPSAGATGKESNDQRKNILVIGDVHGCLDELLILHQKAVKENDFRDFHYIVLVGDLCNKGPYSAQVVKHVRSQDRWLAVRGNHDDGALAAALSDAERQQRKKYSWAIDQSNPETCLTDADIEYLADLPYTLRIPKSYLGDAVDTVVVHAGLVPNLPLEENTIETMTTIREVQKKLSSAEYRYYKGRKESNQASSEDILPWASVWKGPFRVVFGHDAQRGYQRYEGDFAIGLDTGCCYGKKLTGIILPSKEIVDVDALQVYSPIANKKD